MPHRSPVNRLGTGSELVGMWLIFPAPAILAALLALAVLLVLVLARVPANTLLQPASASRAIGTLGVGLVAAIMSAIAEEIVVGAYTITRLEDLGLSEGAVVVVCLMVRSLYHLYYGLGFVLTLPLSYLMTRSFQKHRKLFRTIAAHALYDIIITVISVVVH